MVSIEKIYLASRPKTNEERKINSWLPSFQPTQFGGAYGMWDLAAQYGGLKKAPFPQRSGIWQHGWGVREINNDPVDMLGYNLEQQKQLLNKPCWVGRQDQVESLHTFGFSKARAIGVPICYVQPFELRRIQNSLLVMPPHGDWDSNHVWCGKAFASYVATLSKSFQYIVACVHPTDFATGNWVTDLRLKNIPVISGAFWFDANALKRMAFLFSRFEVILANGFGSHLAYAQLFGAKVAIDGPFTTWVNNDKNFSSIYSERSLKVAYPQLFCRPEDARLDQEWAKKELGCENILMPDEVLEEFGWTESRATQYNNNKKKVAIDHWTFGRHLLRLKQTQKAKEHFDIAKSVSPNACVTGSKLYKFIVNVFGPKVAEFIGEILQQYKNN